ncbi:MAG: hypothetical protein CML15_02965 [Puniceicoccaceae bacterium]|nr:hypothetical protein [Puniceicoccaceae bacterium]
MQHRTLVCLTWLIIIAFAGVLRLSNLETRPIHADEATGARILSQRLTGDYQFNPNHFHGPLLSLLTEPLARVRCETIWQSLSIETLRLSSVIAGILLCLSPLLWRGVMGDYGAALSAALLATSPLLVYYSRMYIHESWLALFGLLGLTFTYRLYKNPNMKDALFAGIFVGCMFATKETSVITLLAWIISLVTCITLIHLGRDSEKRKFTNYLIPTGIASLSALLVSAFFYSNGFRYPDGITDAFRTFLVYETTPGHDKPLTYYMSLLLWPKHLLGQWWTEGAVFLLALLTCVFAVGLPKLRNTIVLIALASIIQVGIYSSIDYKTPWLMLLPWVHVCLLAGFCLSVIRQSHRIAQICIGCFILVALVYQTQQSVAANKHFENDARLPYAYVPTNRNLVSLETWLFQLSEMTPEIKDQTVAVVGNGYWPLPWYLRMFNSIGYWDQPEVNMIDAPLVFSVSDSDQATNKLLNDSHVAFPRGLRTNVSMTLHLRKDLWTKWINNQP